MTGWDETVNLSGKRDLYRTHLWRESGKTDHPRGNFRLNKIRLEGNSQVKGQSKTDVIAK
jgi:hypothetical protein